MCMCVCVIFILVCGDDVTPHCSSILHCVCVGPTRSQTITLSSTSSPTFLCPCRAPMWRGYRVRKIHEKLTKTRTVTAVMSAARPLSLPICRHIGLPTRPPVGPRETEGHARSRHSIRHRLHHHFHHERVSITTETAVVVLVLIVRDLRVVDMETADKQQGITKQQKRNRFLEDMMMWVVSTEVVVLHLLVMMTH